MSEKILTLLQRIVFKLLPKQRAAINRAEIIDHVRDEGRMTSRFTFMTVISSGVATLGLLQSSPAVVIGAMLISPLMSPIVALGFGICIMDFRLLRKSLEAVILGTLIALIVSYTLVSLSPLNDPTPEILARTSPNLLDLIIAVFSALAGGYAVIKRKGETLVGVAIATALMPPLAVIGYGLATGKSAITSGSFFLYMTNLLAIALTITLLAVWYGFGYKHGKHHGKWQIALVLAVLGILSIPLGNSLKNIAYEAVTTNNTKSIISGYFAKNNTSARIELFHISFPENNKVKIDTLILTKKYDYNAQEEILTALQNTLGANVELSLDQLVTSQEPENVKTLSLQSQKNTLSAPVTGTENKLSDKNSLDSIAQLRKALPIAADVAPAPDKPAAFVIHPKPVNGGTISLYRTMEEELRERFDELDIIIIPPVSRLPDIYFNTGQESMDESGAQALEDCLWALKRWEINQVQVVGFASTAGEQSAFDNKSLAYRRGQNVANHLQQAGIHTQTKPEYQTYEQREIEKRRGMDNFQKVEIRLMPAQAEQETVKEHVE